MIPKNKIRLSRTLAAQTSPYPQANRWIRRGFFFLLAALALGIYFSSGSKPENKPLETTKQILGEQETQDSAVEYQTYTVKKGDTLFNLSQKHAVSWQTLAEINNLEQPYILKIGQTLKIPEKNN